MNVTNPVSIRALVFLVVICVPAPGHAQIKAQARTGGTPAWGKGILPINQESYWNAVECGKLGGDDPACVFWDAGLCKNPDFTLAMYTPYKAVAYEVWRAVRAKQPVPTPNYMQAQQTRITVGITPVRGSKNPLKDLILKRGGKPVAPVSRSVTTGDARFTFDYPAFAATSDVTLELVGATSTLSCSIPRSVLLQFR
jgi:hypothetical protein